MKVLDGRRQQGRRVAVSLVTAAAAAVTSHICSGPAPALAGTIRHDIPDSQYLALGNDPKYQSVGAVLSASDLLSGVLISPKFVLTAAHGTNNANPHFFNVGGSTFGGGTNLAAAQHFTHESYTFLNPDPFDIGLMRMGSVVAGVQPASRFFGTDDTNRVGTMVGYGKSGTGSTGFGGSYGTKRAVQNMLDDVIETNYIVSDFDDPNDNDGSNTFGSALPVGPDGITQILEGSIAEGDSGGGVFVDVGPRHYLAGHHLFIFAPTGSDGVANSSYSDSMGAMRINQFNEWIDDNISNTWNSAASGAFGTATNWDVGPTVAPVNLAPGAGDIVGFNTVGAYTVTLAGPVTNHMLLARRGNVTMNLSGSAYTLDSTMFEGAVVVGRYGGNAASVTFLNGTVNSNDAILGQLVGSAGTVSVGSNSTWNVNGDLYAGGTFGGGGGRGAVNVTTATSALNVSGTLRVYANGTVNYSGGSLSTGTLDVRNGGRVILSVGGNKVLRAKVVNTNTSGRIDLADNDMVVQYDGASPIGNVRAMLRNGYNGGVWNGNGILSSRAATSPNAGEAKRTALGYGESGTLGETTFAGLSVDPTTVLIKYTYAGDADLDGDTDGGDIGAWALHFTGALGVGVGNSLWTDGDWDYDGDVDGGDASIWAQSFTGSLSPGLGSDLNLGGDTLLVSSPINPQAVSILQGLGITVVPEPASIGLLGTIAAWSLQRPRARRSRKRSARS